MIRLRLLLALTLVFVAAPARADGEKGLFPLSVGNHWTYKVDKTLRYRQGDQDMGSDRVTGTSVERITGVTDSTGPVAPALFVLRRETEERSLNHDRVSKGVLTSYVSNDDEGIRVHAQKIESALGVGELSSFQKPFVLLKLPLAPEDPSYPTRLEGPGLTISVTPSSVTRETLETPLGKLPCLKLLASGSISPEGPASAGSGLRGGTVEIQIWFSEGVGIVQKVENVQLEYDAGEGRIITTMTDNKKVLTRYELAGASSSGS